MYKRAIVLIAVLAAIPAFAQYSNTWQTAADIIEGVQGSMTGTVTDVDEAQNRFLMAPDNERNGQVQVVTDAVSTQYNGFGDVINGKPEIYTGSRGFANVRVGDRVDVRGIGRSAGSIRADFITLVGRSVPAPQVGVGDTRSPAQGISTPPVGSTTTVPGGSVEGTVQQVNASDNRIVIESNGRQIFTVRTARNTPVYYQGQTYEVGNLEVGDRIRVDADPTSSTGELRARSIQVVQSKEDAANGARVSTVSGRVIRIDRTGDVARVDTGRGEVRVDMSRAYDPNGRRVRAADLQVGDQVDISGAYGTTSDIFAASTIRFGDEGSGGPGAVNAAGTGQPAEPGLVTIIGTVTDTIADAGNIVLRERTTGRVVQLYASDDFVVKTKAGGYTTADKLTVDQNVTVRAYRDSDGNYIAQSIRIR